MRVAAANAVTEGVAATGPNITAQPANETVGAGQSASFTVVASGVPSTLSYEWFLNGQALSANTNAATLNMASATAANAGVYTVQITNGQGGIVTSNAALLTVGAPQFTAQPQSQAAAAGSSLALSAGIPGAGVSYQWQFGGMAIAGATGPTLTLTNLGATQAGSYTVTARDSYGQTTSSAATVTVNSNAWLMNLSARAYVAPTLSPGDILIAGFNTAGPDPKAILLRGDGPALGAAPFDVPGPLADPQLTLFDASKDILATTTTWISTLAATFASLGAFPLAPGSNDTAFLQTVSAGGYTAQVTSTNGQDGVALAEIYDADAGAPTDRLVNCSARAYCGSGADILIGGFIIAGTTSETVLVRAVGPALSLSPFNLTGVLTNPILSVDDATGAVVASNAGWGNPPIAGASAVAAGIQPATAAVMSAVGAFTLVPGSADSAMVLTLPPGDYTAEVSGAGGTTGIGLVEIYEVR